MARKSNLDEIATKMVGQKYGNLTIDSLIRSGSRKDIYYQCTCSCGNIISTRKSQWNKVKSCGCKSRSYEDVNKAAFSLVYSSYRHSAKSRKLTFELTKEEFHELTQKPCIYCATLPSNIKKSTNGNYIYSGIDRLDNKAGYIYDNCAPCCKRCNFLKSSLNQDKFIEILHTIIKQNTLNTGLKESKLESYYARALTIATNSHDEQTKVGALLINPKSGAVLAEGYNGFVRGAKDSELPKTRPEKYPYMVHAEMNLLCNAVRHGISTDDCVIFCTLSPCVNCVRMLYQSGISTIYFKDLYSDIEKSTNMGDLILDITNINDYYKMTVRPKT